MGTFIDRNFRHIRDRKSFYETLDAAIQASETYKRDDAIASVLRQLLAVKDATKGDQTPPAELVKRLTIPRIIEVGFSHLRDSVPEVDDWAQLCAEVHLYVRHWMDDQEFEEADDDDIDWF